MHTGAHRCVQTHTHTYTYILRVHTKTYQNIQIHTNTSKFILNTKSMYKYIQIDTTVRKSSNMCKYLQTLTDTNKYVQLLIHAYENIHTYIYIHIHTH